MQQQCTQPTEQKYLLVLLGSYRHQGLLNGTCPLEVHDLLQDEGVGDDQRLRQGTATAMTQHV